MFEQSGRAPSTASRIGSGCDGTTRTRGSLCAAVVFVLWLICAPPTPAATITVNSTSDAVAVDGQCTLREAILQANTNAPTADCGAGDPSPTQDVIEFAIPGPGVHTIQPTSPLPTTAFLEPVFINGYSQPGASPNTLEIGNDAVLLIELDGTNVTGPPPTPGIWIGGSHSEVRGLIINRFPQDGVLTTFGTEGVIVAGNFVGTDETGTIALGNDARGVFLRGGGGSALGSNTLGGPNPADRNVIAGSSTNVVLQGVGLSALGNYVGTNATGTAAIPGSNTGFRLEGQGLVVGTSGAGNLISGHTSLSFASGIRLSSAVDAVIEANLMGTDATGLLPIPNSNGVMALPTCCSTPLGSTIGSPTPGAGNLIAFNLDDGVVVTTANELLPTGHSIRGNSIHSNGVLGIDLGLDGVDPNDLLDEDNGPNGLQNAPVLTGAELGAGTLDIDWSVSSSPDSSFTLDYYAATLCGITGFGEGELWLGSTVVVTDGAGVSIGSETVPGPGSGFSALTATLTSEYGDTSEFSACLEIEAAPVHQIPSLNLLGLLGLTVLLGSSGFLRARA